MQEIEPTLEPHVQWSLQTCFLWSSNVNQNQNLGKHVLSLFPATLRATTTGKQHKQRLAVCNKIIFHWCSNPHLWCQILPNVVRHVATNEICVYNLHQNMDKDAQFYLLLLVKKL